jgi:DNA-binding SARP family transcriptional activator
MADGRPPKAEPGEADLQIHLLGAPTLLVRGQRARPETSKTLALLAYLCMERRVHRRDALAAFLWGERDQARAARSLRRAFWNLRRVLNPGGDGECPHLTVKRHEAAFNRESEYWLDAEAFERLTDLSGDESSARLQQRLKRAIGIYRGDFLRGLTVAECPSFERWVLSQRAYLKERAFQAYYRLSELYAARGAYAEATETLRSYLTLAPWREESHRQLMLMLALQGERELAIRQFEICREILQRELGVAPSEETRRLRRRISEKKATHRATGATDEGSPDLPFVGRGDAYRWMLRRRARRGLTLVAGAAGVGKSRLVNEVLRRSAADGASILRGRCYEFQGALPYQAVNEALGQYVERIADVGTLDLPGPVLAELARLVPAVRRRWPGLEPAQPAGGSQGRERFFDSVAALLRAMRRPVLFLDDLHWADAATLDLLHYLVRALEGDSCWFVGAYRVEETRLDHPLTRLIHGLSRDELADRLELSPLTEDDIAEVTADRLSQGEVETLAAYLFRQSGGNPYIVTEMVGLLAEEGCLEVRQDGWRLVGRLDGGNVLPSRVQDVVLQRVGRLSEEGRWAMNVAAVIGRPFRSDFLARAAGLPEGTVDDHLDSWRMRRLMSCNNDGWCDFDHDKIRASVYHHLAEPVRRLVHERVAHVLMEDGPDEKGPLERSVQKVADDDAGRVAYHFERSLDPSQAAPFLVQAARSAMEVYAHELAIDYYRRALSLLTQDEDRASVMVDLAHAQHVTGRWADVEELYRRGIDLAREAGVPQVEARAWHLVAEAQESQGEYRGALMSAARAEDAAREAGEKGRGVLAAALHRKGWALFRLGDPESALSLGREALGLGRVIEDWKVQADSLNLLSAIHNQAGAYDRATACMKEALALFREAGYRRGEAVMLGNLGNTAYLQGAYERAADRYREGLALARQIGHRYTEMLCLNNLGGALVAVRAYAEASACLEQVLEMPESENWFLLPDTCCYLAEARLALDELDEALAAARRLLRAVRMREEAAPEYEGAAWRILGHIARANSGAIEVGGEHRPAEWCFGESLRIFEEAGLEEEYARTVEASN